MILSTGRWTTPDPLGFVDGPNLYAYVHNNPLTHFDLYGLMTGPVTASCGTASAGAREVRVASSPSSIWATGISIQVQDPKVGVSSS